MNIKKGFMGGFLVFGFAVFIVGFLIGMLAFILMPSTLTSNVETINFMIFVLGFLTGILTIALLLAAVKLTQLTKESK